MKTLIALLVVLLIYHVSGSTNSELTDLKHLLERPSKIIILLNQEDKEDKGFQEKRAPETAQSPVPLRPGRSGQPNCKATGDVSNSNSPRVPTSSRPGRRDHWNLKETPLVLLQDVIAEMEYGNDSN